LCDEIDRQLTRDRPSHAAAVRALVEFGELEAAWCDRLMPEMDGASPTVEILRRVAVGTGHLLRCAWSGAALPPFARRPVAAAVAALRRESPPSPLRVRTPEGFAFYGLYPETYLQAAEEFAGARRAGSALCLGLRSIGAPLSAVVGAALEARGWEVRSHTVRPRGPPFDRRLLLSPGFAQALSERANGEALIVDEGPGISGSSMARAATLLSRLGYADDRIVFFPSWRPDPQALFSLEARARWPRHAAYIGSFERAWIDSGRLAAAPLRALDAGRWRPLFFQRGDFPAVHPQHERRKYLEAGEPTLLLKFAGLGAYGDAAWQRAAELAHAGFTPPAQGLQNGFLRQGFAAGQPLREEDCTPLLIDRVARYAAFLQRRFPADRRTPGEALRAMAIQNTRELLGPEAGDDLESLLSSAPFEDGPSVAIDGRMQPWEWLATPQGYLKADAIDHHADHFYPGCTDVAWDLAGFAVEFDLDGGAVEALLRGFTGRSGDARIGARLPAFRLAYAAFRAGYARLAAQTTAGAAESPRFRALAARYTRQLFEALIRMRRGALG
jgi:hypothetical protein